MTTLVDRLCLGEKRLIGEKRLRQPRVSILIVNWNTRDLVLGCLESIPEATEDLPCEVIVVDNGSVDGSSEALARRTDITLIENDENLGFAVAVNQAYRRSSGELVLLLNSDVLLTAQALHSMTRFLEDHPTIAGVAPLYVFPDGSPQPFHYRFPTFSVTLANCSSIARRVLPGICRSIAGIPDARRRLLESATRASAGCELPAPSTVGSSLRPHPRRALSDLLQRRPTGSVVGRASVDSLGNARGHGRPRGACLHTNARWHREAAIPRVHRPHAQGNRVSGQRVAVSIRGLCPTHPDVGSRRAEHHWRQAVVERPFGRRRPTSDSQGGHDLMGRYRYASRRPSPARASVQL